MKLKLSRMILVGSIITMIGLSISMCINDKEKIKIEELRGSKSTLEGVNIIFQKVQNSYKTTKTTISKDGISKDKFVVTTPNRFSDAQDLITNEDMLNYSQGIVGTYQYDNYVGVVSVGIHYTNETSNDEKLEIVATVMEENIETGKLTEYTIPLDTYFKNSGDNGISTNTVPIRYEDNLYIVVGVDIENYNNINTYENQIEESRIYVYKLDLESESSENILTKSLSKDGESAIGYNAAFAKDDTAYFVNTLYSKNDKYEVKRETQLLSFSLKTRKFETIELGKDGESNEEEELDGLWNIFKYYLIDDKAYFIYDYIGGEKFEIREMEVDLNTKKIVNKEIAYSLEFDDSIKNSNRMSYTIENIRCIDNKLFISIETQKDTEASWDSRPITTSYLYIVDRNSKKTLYAVKGNIENNENSVYDGNISLSVVK